MEKRAAIMQHFIDFNKEIDLLCHKPFKYTELVRNIEYIFDMLLRSK